MCTSFHPITSFNVKATSKANHSTGQPGCCAFALVARPPIFTRGLPKPLDVGCRPIVDSLGRIKIDWDCDGGRLQVVVDHAQPQLRLKRQVKADPKQGSNKQGYVPEGGDLMMPAASSVRKFHETSSSMLVVPTLKRVTHKTEEARGGATSKGRTS